MITSASEEDEEEGAPPPRKKQKKSKSKKKKKRPVIAVGDSPGKISISQDVIERESQDQQHQLLSVAAKLRKKIAEYQVIPFLIVSPH